MYLPAHFPDMFARAPSFLEAIEAKLDETSTYVDSDLDIVDGLLSDVVRAVLETL